MHYLKEERSDYASATRFRARRFVRTIAIIVAAAHLNLCLQPLVQAATLPSKPKAVQHTPGNEEKLAATLEQIEQQLEKLDQTPTATTQPTQRALTVTQTANKAHDELKRLNKELRDQDRQALKDFNQIEKHLKDRKLPQVILDRHKAAVKTYKQEMALLKANLDDMDKAKDGSERGARAKKAMMHLKAKQKKRQQKFNPNDLPHKSLQPNPNNKPKLNRSEFRAAGLHDNPLIKLAALGDFKFDKLTGASDPAYLAATTEVVLTDAIKAKAAELNYDAVKIYNWVRNNVEWLPTWGASQDADVTLGSQRGNAFDIASLLIALLRASGIPSRYVHGVIEVPVDKFMNWAGGFTDIKAAGDYASSGGIPITGIISGGQITKMQLEHIWVEAATDFHPSRGAINKSADAWVQLDASYKQYQDLQGLDVVAISGIDPNALAQSFANSGTSNQQEGWVKGLDPTILQNAQTQAQTKLNDYIKNNLTNPTVGDVIGGRKVVAQTVSVFSAGLSNRTVVIGARYGTLPPELQHTMTFAFGFDPIGDTISPVTFPWAKLNNHKVTLSFKPATAADEQTLASLLPPGPITDPSQLPSSIPSYLITVIPEIAVEGQVVAQGNAMRLGEDLELVFQPLLVNGTLDTKTYKVPAGAYLSLGPIRGSVSPQVLLNLKAKLEQTKTTLESGNTGLIGALTREDTLGDMFHAGTLGYFGQYITLSRIAGLSQATRHNLAAGFGSFGYEPKVNTFFGFPRAITTGNVAVNVYVGSISGNTATTDLQKRRDFHLQTGMISSALEHAVPEQMLSTVQQPAQGVSAAKALQIAAQQGQRIYHITLANQAQALPNLHLDGIALSEISQALVTGKEVIAHTDRISVPGFTGEGYILFDPLGGDGAYKITGGANGAVVKWVNDNSTWLNFVALGLGFLGGSLALLGLLIGLIIAQAFILMLVQELGPDSPCFGPAAWLYGGVVIGLAIVAILFSKVGIANLALALINNNIEGAIQEVFKRFPACKLTEN